MADATWLAASHYRATRTKLWKHVYGDATVKHGTYSGIFGSIDIEVRCKEMHLEAGRDGQILYPFTFDE